MKDIFLIILLTLTARTINAQSITNASDIMLAIKNGGDIRYSNTTIKGVLDFTFINETLPKLSKRNRWWNSSGSNTVTKEIKNEIYFINCTFIDDVLAYIPHEESGYTFVANFENRVTFKNCFFRKKALFKYSEFDKKVECSLSKFYNDTTFKYAKFKDKSNFKGTYFDEPTTFKYANFEEYISFEDSVFDETASFKYTKFNRGVSFNNVKFKEDLNLKYAKVKGPFDIKNMEVTFNIDAKYTNINGESFNKYQTNK